MRPYHPNTTEDISKQTPSQWETPQGAQEKADKARDDAIEATEGYADQAVADHKADPNAHPLATSSSNGFMSGADKSKLDTHVGNGNIHVTTQDKSKWNTHVDNGDIHVTESQKTSWTNHVNDGSIHTTQAEKDKLANIEAGAEVNQNAFSFVDVAGIGNISADGKQATISFEGGTGISISIDNGKLRITATGEATPGPHALEHIPGGSDVIPNATTTESGLMSSADKAKVDSIKDGTLTEKGLVQLNNSVNSTNQTQAATPSAVKIANDTANEALDEAITAQGMASDAQDSADAAQQTADAAFTQVSNGKDQIATAITDMGQSASGSDTFLQLSNKIKDISKDATALPADVLTPKSFYQAGLKRTGTMPNRTGHVTGQSISRTGTTLRIRPTQGHYPGTTTNSVQWNDPNFKAENIKEGVEMFGLLGTLIEGTRTETGSFPTSPTEKEVRGLPFQPSMVIVHNPTSNTTSGFWIYTTGSSLMQKNMNTGTSSGGVRENGIFTIYPDGFEINIPSAPSGISGGKWVAFA